MYLCEYLCVCIYVSMCVFMCMCVCLAICISMYVYTCISLCVYVCAFVCLCGYVCICICVYKYTINRDNLMHENIHMFNVCVNKFSCRLHNIVNTSFKVEITKHVILIQRLVAMYTSLFCYRDS